MSLSVSLSVSCSVFLSSSNGHNTITGTTIYMSPEVMRGNETDDESAPIGYGRKADIWSVGITIVEMATGKMPFRNAAAAIYTICVSKEYPTLPREFSIEAHHILSRYIQLTLPPLTSLCHSLSHSRTVGALLRILRSEPVVMRSMVMHFVGPWYPTSYLHSDLTTMVLDFCFIAT
jgi:serine/threonine protein kinase